MRKPALLTLASLFISVSVNAQLGSDGYYRIQNTNTTRYVRLIDNKGEVDMNTTSVDLGALQTVMYFDNVVSDPSSVIYISHIANDEYDIKCQGMSLVKMIGFGMRFQKLKSGHYVAFQEQRGLRKVLNDLSGSSVYGAVLTNDATLREWDIVPISDENYFGIKPDFEKDGKYYKSFFADFPFKFKSAGMKAWYVKQVDSEHGVCVVEEITGTIPASTPVIIECSSDSPRDNMLDIQAAGAAPLSGNLLNGVYFDNSNKKHYNRVEYTSSNMRVLGITADGKLGYVTDQSLKFIPMNSCYVKADGAPAELLAMDEASYKDYLDSLPSDSSVPSIGNDVDCEIYSIGGIRVNCKVSELPAGIWIVNGRKFIVRD